MKILAIIDTSTHLSPYLLVWGEDVPGIRNSTRWKRAANGQYKRPLKNGPGGRPIPPGLKDQECYEIKLNERLIPVAINNRGWWDI